MLVPPPGGVLPDAVEAELEALCAAWGAEPYPGSPAARAALASVDAGAAVRALRRVAARGRRGPSGRTAGSETLASAIVRAVAEGSSSDGNQSTVGIFNQAAGVPSWVLNNPAQAISVRLEQMVAPSRRFLAATPLNLEVGKPQKASSDSQNASPQMLALGELVFSKVFMIFGYLGCNKIEDVLNEEDIRSLKFLSMPHFESEIWHKFGHKYVAASDRVKNLDWDPSKKKVYYCNVDIKDGSVVTTFKGPYMDSTTNHLQTVLGDDNVLIVKFANVTGDTNDDHSFAAHYQHYRGVIDSGIILGLRRYRFFVYKNGGKPMKRTNHYRNRSSVSCYFVRTESEWDRDHPYILSNKTIDQARNLFMHIHTAPDIANYMSSFALILSRSIKPDVDLSNINITMIEDVPCKDEYGNIVLNAEGKPLIHTTGTGFISEDLAMKCPTGIFRGKASKPFELQDNIDFDENDTLTRLANSRGHPTHIPILMQSHLFSNGCVVKGTFLVDRRLPPRTIHIRPSMIKVKADPNSIDVKSFNSLEVISTSNRPKRALTSWFLIALLHYGGVPAEYFMKLLLNASDGIHSICHVTNDALKASLSFAEMDNSISAQMILSGISVEEPYLQSRLEIMAKEEMRGLRHGKIPIDDSFLMGTTDPTGCLKPNEVCVILGDGQLSGDVLVYMYPGLHLGDIHVLTATYIWGLEDIVGNSKYAIFFPVSGSQAMASSFGGNMFWVSRNSELLKYFKPCQSRLQRITQKRKEQKNPQHYGSSLESALFDDFLRTRFTLSSSPDAVANCWLAYMDRLLSCEVSITEKKYLKDKMLSLVDAYNEALDDWKTLNKVQVPGELMVKHYPHFMEQTGCHSYHSKSVLGAIYDEALSQIKNRLPIEISFLQCFTDVEVSEMCMERWRNRYQEYLWETRSLFLLDSKEGKNMKLQQVHAKYKQMLYGAAKFEETPRDRQTVFDEACAIYQIAYGSARAHGDVSKCGFAWNVAGDALCHLYVLKHGSSSVAMVRSLLQL